MQLRSHPMMSCKGRPSWPPQWAWVAGADKTEIAAGEVGTIERVQPSHVLGNTLFLTISTPRGTRFTGQLKFDEERFAGRILSLLHSQIGQPIKDIAEIDIA